MSISYREKNGKYIVCKDGVFASYTLEQVIEMNAVMRDIIEGRGVFYQKDARRTDGKGKQA